MNGAKSGTSMRWLARITRAPPSPMPNRATPTGQAHRQHRPEGDDQDDDGEGEAEQLGRRLLELGEQEPAQLDAQPVDLRDELPDLVADLGGTREVDVLGEVDGGERDRCPARSPCGGDLELAAGRVGALDGR